MVTAKMRAGAEALAEQVRAADQAEQRRSWRKVTTIMSAFGISRLTPSARESVAEVLISVGLECEPGFDVVARSGTVRLSVAAPVDGELSPRSGVPTDKPGGVGAIDSVLSRIELWSPGVGPRAHVPLTDRPPGTFLVADVPPGEDAATVYAAMAPMCRYELLSEMVEDLMDADEIPKVNFEVGWRARVVSVFGANVEDEPGTDGLTAGDNKAGTVFFDMVEMVVGSDWLIMCWHNAVKLPPVGNPTDAKSKLRESVLTGVATRWADSGETSADFAMLVGLELMRVHEAAQSNIATWLELWESAFAQASQLPTDATGVDLDPALQIETETLKSVRRVLGEFRKRIQAQDSSRHSAIDRKWLPGVTIAGAEDEMRSFIAQATTRVDAAAQSLRGATELLTMSQVREQLQLARRAQMEAEAARVEAKREQANTERFQQVLTVLGAILLGPGLVAAIYGANVDLPGRDRLAGTVILIVGMVVVSALSLVLVRVVQRRHR